MLKSHSVRRKVGNSWLLLVYLSCWIDIPAGQIYSGLPILAAEVVTWLANMAGPGTFWEGKFFIIHFPPIPWLYLLGEHPCTVWQCLHTLSRCRVK